MTSFSVVTPNRLRALRSLLSLKRLLLAAPALASLTVAGASFSADTRTWPGHIGSGLRDSTVQIHAPTQPGAVACITFKNEPVHNSDETFSLTWEGVTASIIFDWQVGGGQNEALTITASDGLVAVPYELSVAEGAHGVSCLFEYLGG